MGQIYKCGECGCNEIEYDTYKCRRCGSKNVESVYIQHPMERRRNAVYATGNKWIIENWNATH